MNQDLLEELTRNVPSTKLILFEAWHSLSVESKLTVILMIQSQNNNNTPNWLFDLAIEDAANIVRYYATRSVSLSTDPDFKGNPPATYDVESRNKIENDNSEFVKNSYRLYSSRYKLDFLSLALEDKLLFIRSSFDFKLYEFLKLVKTIYSSDMGDKDIEKIIVEIIRHKDFKNVFYDDKWPDPTSRAELGNELKELWEILLKSDRIVPTKQILKVIAFEIGYFKFNTNDLLSINEDYLFTLIYRSIEDKSPYLTELISKIKNNESQFSANLLEYLTTIENYKIVK